MTASVTNIRDARPLLQVYSCGKCQEQGAVLAQHGAILCGSGECTARMAALWYAPTDLKTIAQFPRPHSRVIDGRQEYHCFHCGYPYFHMQRDHTLTCFREQCKRQALFRWVWENELGG